MGRPLEHDHVGERFGNLLVVSYEGYGKWKCFCDCGNEVIVRGTDLRAGKVISCGCEKTKRVIKMSTSHGMSGTRIYRVWRNMKTRCTNPNCNRYADYGGRGVTVCDEWTHDFTAFYDWAIANGYEEDAPYGQCTLDRIDVNGNYEPSNCRWVDLTIQANNKRERTYTPANPTRVQLIDEDGEVVHEYSSIAEASRQTGCRRTSISAVCTGRYKHSLGLRWQYA